MACRNAILIAIVSALGFVGCEMNDGPAEDAGEALDEAAENTANAVEDACEDAKEGVDAEDTDC
jgi:hypothetical protein